MRRHTAELLGGGATGARFVAIGPLTAAHWRSPAEGLPDHKTPM
jgi:hypothetical protein